MTNQHISGNLFSLTIPGKDKPTKIYGILHRDKPTVSYGILIQEDENMNRLNVKDGWWSALVKNEIKFINVNSEFYKTERHINEN
jgi:hypothetical protein